MEEDIYLACIYFDGYKPSKLVYFQSEKAANDYIRAFLKSYDVRSTECKLVKAVRIGSDYYLADKLSVFKTAKEKALSDVYLNIHGPERNLVSRDDFKDRSV